MKPKQKEWYEKGFHDGVSQLMDDLIEHGTTGKKILNRLEFWIPRIEKLTNKYPRKGE